MDRAPELGHPLIRRVQRIRPTGDPPSVNATRIYCYLCKTCAGKQALLVLLFECISNNM